jgi:hypothetical protein
LFCWKDHFTIHLAKKAQMSYQTTKAPMKVAFRLACGAILSGALVILIGCNSAAQSKNEVKGKVSYKGATLPGGHMVFYSAEDANLGEAVINSDGTYTTVLSKTGPCKVTVETESLKPPEQPKPPANAPMPNLSEEDKRKMKESMAKSSGAAGNYVAIPKKYANVKTTPLTYDVASGKQTKDFDLSD